MSRRHRRVCTTDLFRGASTYLWSQWHPLPDAVARPRARVSAVSYRPDLLCPRLRGIR